MKGVLVVVGLVSAFAIGVVASHILGGGGVGSILGVSQPEWVSIHHPGLIKPDDVRVVSVKLYKPTTQQATIFDITYQLKGSVAGDVPSKDTIFVSTTETDKVGMSPDLVKVADGTKHFSFPIKIAGSFANDCQAIITVTQRHAGAIGDPIVLLIDNGDGVFAPFEPIKP